MEIESISIERRNPTSTSGGVTITIRHQVILRVTLIGWYGQKIVTSFEEETIDANTDECPAIAKILKALAAKITPPKPTIPNAQQIRQRA